MSGERRMNAFGNAFEQLLGLAVSAGASDIHLEPMSGLLRARIRVHGRLKTVREIVDAPRADRLMEVAKRECGFDLGSIGVPQDSRFARDDLGHDFRAALIPVLDGEKIVLRLLQRDQRFDLDKYQLRADAKLDLRTALVKSDGLIVVSGPTGSGKSTLLYNALGSLDRAALNVGTIEDPVEYRLAGLSQSPVNRARGGSFAGLLRAFMRGDPDVILVGEIRDHETAEAAMHAASTGHLVLSTVHANSAMEIEERLEGLGVRRELYRSNLRFASAQRLMPRLCPACRVKDPEGSALVSAAYEEELVAYDAKGCAECRKTGVVGRVLLFEWLRRDRSSGELALQDTLRREAMKHVILGEISARAACSF